MDFATLQTLHPDGEQIRLASRLVALRAHIQALAPVVNEYKTEILQKNKWPVDFSLHMAQKASPEIFNKIAPAGYIESPKDTMLLSKEHYRLFELACQARQKDLNLKTLDGTCSDGCVLDAEFKNYRSCALKLIESLQQFTSITPEQALAVGSERFTQLADLCTRIIEHRVQVSSKYGALHRSSGQNDDEEYNTSDSYPTMRA